MKVTCTHCGAANIGVQDHCLVCGQPLPAVPRGAPARPAGPARVDHCPACHAGILPGARFCQKCGASVNTPDPGDCPSCGAALQPGMKFCRKCGAELAKARKK